MRKYKLYLLIISSLMLFAGCSRQDNTDNLLVTLTPSPSVEMALTATLEPTKEPKSDESEVASTLQPDNYMEMGLKEDWEYIEQAGIDESAKINAQKSSGNSDHEVLPICYCEAYDVLYYINFKDNKFIYRCKDNEVKAAVKIPADNLYIRNGELYFRVVGTYDDLIGVKEGNICKYSPITGKIELMVAGMDAEWMTVSNEGIYYKVLSEMIPNDKGGYTLKYSMYCYDFEKATAEIIDSSSSLVLWESGYSVSSYWKKGEDDERVAGIWLHKIGTTTFEDETIILGNYYCDYSIRGDILYCDDADYFNVVQLDTGEIKQYKKIDAHGFAYGGMGAFTVNDNKAYQSHLVFYIDLETGIVHSLRGEGGKYVTKLFNVNNKIYALYYEKGYHSTRPTGTPELMEVVFDEETTKTRYREYLGYKFVSIGE